MSFLLCTCTKFGKNVTIKGRVLNPITGEGIPNVELELLRGTGGLPGGYKSVKSTKTDASGNFEISKGGLSTYSLACRVSSDYYQIGWIKDGVNVTQAPGNLNIKKGKTMHVDYHAVPYGEILTSIENINCQGSGDTLIFKREYISSTGVYVFQPIIKTGCFLNIGAFSKVPSGWYNIEWTVIRSGISETFNHNLLVPANGQASYHIQY
jgi:hypothetical protein